MKSLKITSLIFFISILILTSCSQTCDGFSRGNFSPALTNQLTFVSANNKTIGFIMYKSEDKPDGYKASKLSSDPESDCSVTFTTQYIPSVKSDYDINLNIDMGRRNIELGVTYMKTIYLTFEIPGSIESRFHFSFYPEMKDENTSNTSSKIKKIDSIQLNGIQYDDIKLMVLQKNNLFIDSIYFSEPDGLIQFSYFENNNWVAFHKK